MLFAGVLAYAQDGAYSGFTPYSIFGVGQMYTPGSAYNKSMGGVGTASRNRKYINMMNPASVTARDTLSFMADVSIVQNNSVFRQGDMKSANNIFNVNDLALSFPLYKSSAMMFGLTPYSTTGYSYASLYDNPDLLGNAGSVAYSAAGQGSLYQVFGAAGVTFWKRLSLGAEFIHYFGYIEKSSNVTFASSNYSGISSGYNLTLRGNAARFGIQYEQPIGTNYVLGIGATYKTGSKLTGFVEDYVISSGAAQVDSIRHRIDTLGMGIDKVGLASEFSVGVSLRFAEKWRAEIDYTRSDWTNTGIDATTGFAVSGVSKFTATNSESIRAGFEIIPNANDIRYYYRRIAYRAGAYYDKSHFLLDGNAVNAYGITFGATLPLSRTRTNTGITLSADFGRRASLAGNLIRETYCNFTVGFNIHDYWFHKYRYE